MKSGARKLLGEANQLRRTGRWSEARSLYRKVLTRRPDEVEALVGCAEAERRLGSLDESEKLLTRALRLKSDDPKVLVALGRTQISRRKFRQATRALRTAVRIDDRNVDALLELGRLHVASFNPEPAIRALRHGLRVDPEHPDLLRNLGDAYQMLGRWDDAVNVYECARDAGGAGSKLHYNLATCYRAVGRFDEAVASYDKALEADPDLLEAQAGLAHAHESLGRFDESEALAATARTMSPPPAAFAEVIARIADRRGQRDEAIDFIQRALAPGHLNASHRAQLLFQLGSLYEREEQYDESFDAYRSANDLFPKHFDAEGYRELIDRIIAVFSAERVAPTPSASRASRVSDHSQRPVFIVGMPRSGTSVAEQILSAHSRVLGAGELEILPRLVQHLPNRIRTKTPYPECIEEMNADVLDALANEYLDGLREELERAAQADPAAIQHDRVRRITDKLPHNFLHLGFIALAFPGARIIHMRRDPADTCFSCYATSLSAAHAYANRLNDLGFAYRQYERLTAHWRDLIDDDQMLEVRYEDLVHDPEAWARRLVEFIGLEWEASCLRFFESDRVTLTASRDQVRQPIYRSSVGRAQRFAAHLEPLRRALRGA